MLNVFKYYDTPSELDKSEISGAIRYLGDMYLLEDDPEAEQKMEPVKHLIKRNPELASEYATYILKDRWIEAESIIMSNSEAAYSYIKDVVKERLPESLEKIIMGNSDLALTYAKYVIGGRWVEGEKAIVQNAANAYLYAEEVLKGRWKEAEPIIKKNPMSAYYYAARVIKGRFFDAEPYIREDGYWWNAYKIKFGI